MTYVDPAVQTPAPEPKQSLVEKVRELLGDLQSGTGPEPLILAWLERHFGITQGDAPEPAPAPVVDNEPTPEPAGQDVPIT